MKSPPFFCQRGRCESLSGGLEIAFLKAENFKFSLTTKRLFDS